MIVIMKPNASEEAVKRVTGIIESKGLTAHLSKGDQVTIIGVVGDKTRLYGSNIEITTALTRLSRSQSPTNWPIRNSTPSRP